MLGLGCLFLHCINTGVSKIVLNVSVDDNSAFYYGQYLPSGLSNKLLDGMADSVN